MQDLNESRIETVGIKMANKEPEYTAEKIAIIGMACRYPQANNIEEFWENITSGRESAVFFSDDELLNNSVPKETLNDKNLVKAAMVLDNIQYFDAEFFGYTPNEAKILDPQIRIFLETAWTALEHAGYNAESYDGRIGIFSSTSISNYLLTNIMKNSNALSTNDGISALLANDKDHTPTRTAYALNCTGPSVSIGTACSSSLSAIHFAAQALIDYQADIMIAGGVTINPGQYQGYYYDEEGIASSDGHCRTFDNRSDGTLTGSGCGIVILKRLEEAIKDGDTIYATLLGSAISNDGSNKVGYTAPGVEGQMTAIMEALYIADIEPDTITYIETHGTGTKLGDPIELDALINAFTTHTQKKQFCGLGSVKSNIGHTDSAAGVAGIIKTVLSLYHKQIPPSLHYEIPNEKIDLEKSPFFINTSLRKWTKMPHPRRAAVSSFAMGGTNVHAILEEAPLHENNEPQKNEKQYQLIPLSAKNENALKQSQSNLLNFLKSNKNIDLQSLAYTLQTGRKSFRYKKWFLAANIHEAIAILNEKSKKNLYKNNSVSQSAKIVFMFSGMGSQYTNMGIDLYNKFDVFRSYLDECFAITENLLHKDIKSLVFSMQTEQKEKTDVPDFFKMVKGEKTDYDSNNPLNKTPIAHAIIFSFDYALARFLMDLGIFPDALIGHSIGEYVAATIAEVFSLEDALSLVINRACLINKMEDGRMLGIAAPEEKVKPFLDETVSISIRNNAENIVVSGNDESISLLKETLQKQNIIARYIKANRAFHSNYMLPMVDEFRNALATVKFHQPKYPVISNTTGKFANEQEIQNADYWIEHSYKAVEFHAGIKTLLENRYNTFIETGAGQLLTGFTLQDKTLRNTYDYNVLQLTKSSYDSKSDTQYLLSSIGKLWLNGLNPKWEELHYNRAKRIPLPTYPFQRKKYWIYPDNDSTKMEKEFPIHDNGLISFFTWKRKNRNEIDVDISPNEISTISISITGNELSYSQNIPDGTKYVLIDATNICLNRENMYKLIPLFDKILIGKYPIIQDRKTLTVIREDINIADFTTIKPEIGILVGYFLNFANAKIINTTETIPESNSILPEFILNDNAVFIHYQNNQRWIIASENIENSTRMLNGSISLNHLLPKKNPDRLYASVAEILNIKSIQQYDALYESLHQYACNLLLEFVTEYFQLVPSKEYSDQELLDQVKSTQHPIVHYIFATLSQNDYLIRQKNVLSINKEPNSLTSTKELYKKLCKQYPQFESYFELLTYVIKKYKDVFNGSIDNTTILYDDNSPLQKTNVFDLLFHEKQLITQITVRDIVLSLLRSYQSQNVKILEVGAGTGLLTKYLIEPLRQFTLSYDFTDIGTSLLNDAEKWALSNNIDFMNFRKFDISQEPASQGFPDSSYDLILAFDVIHATSDIKQTLKNTMRLLKPNGKLIIVEAFHKTIWNNLIWGLQNGWWSFNDSDIREQEPILSYTEWHNLLKNLNMGDFTIIPSDEEQRNFSPFGIIMMENKQHDFDANALPRLHQLMISQYQGNNFQVYSIDPAQKSFCLENADLLKSDKVIIPIRFPQDGSYHYWTEKKLRHFVEHLYKEVDSLIENIMSNNRYISTITFLMLYQTGIPLTDHYIRLWYIYLLAEKNNALYQTTAFSVINIPDDECTVENLLNLTKTNQTMIDFKGSVGNKKSSKTHNEKKTEASEEKCNRQQLSNEYVSPSTTTEEKICNIWKNLFGISNIGTEDNFIELGGDSLLATRFLSALQKQFDYAITLKQFFENPTIKNIAKYVQEFQRQKNTIFNYPASDTENRDEGII